MPTSGKGQRRAPFTSERSRLGDWVNLVRSLPERARELGDAFAAAESAAILSDNAMRFYAIG